MTPSNNIETLRKSISSREMTARAVVERSVDAAERLNETLNAFLQIDRDGALSRAAEIDGATNEANTEEQQALAGVPIAIKDNICVRGLQTSCGSRILGPYHPPYSATVIERLHQAGAVIIGKTNCDEFAMGSSNENSAFGPVRNPWDTLRVPGGSSGGSAAAVAAGIVPAALGSETGGSVRQPAAFCGIVGLKPTYGRFSRYGLVAFASSLDNIGVFGQRARDVAAVTGVIAGRDTHDSTSADVPVPDYMTELEREIKGARIGVPRSLFGEGLDAEVRSTVEAAIESYRELGAEIVEIELPHAKYCIAVYYIIATAEASSNLARFDGVRYGFRAEEASTLRDMYRRTRDQGFGPEVKRRIMLGTYVLSSGYYDAYYRRAQQVRSLIKRDFHQAFERCDVIATPTTPTPAFLLGEKVDDPLAMYLNDIYTCTANLAGIPGISFPCGLSAEKLPIGLQLVGPHWSEPTLLRLAHAFEQARPLDARPQVRAFE
ncbi:MAG TPA: Asp-tRNA(Asn)/Glu-tRNA(Gln) amidotransferase subunit GatA [Pyrinomonadaceae bacterium]|jgi:aspartyl-tRNA(Asn)/glutamyl-tRNA(Gln) amidotransferase subunit A|nr:Asp-tRNA(Asn)/Glu-tRNA(Gln) amidotransferase subunit GatA [Pyrinomonadaceae bacterium]